MPLNPESVVEEDANSNRAHPLELWTADYKKWRDSGIHLRLKSNNCIRVFM